MHTPCINIIILDHKTLVIRHMSTLPPRGVLCNKRSDFTIIISESSGLQRYMTFVKRISPFGETYTCFLPLFSLWGMIEFAILHL